jgi:predicted GNAT family N-acyltransferase
VAEERLTFPFRVEPLSSKHDRAAFSCGEAVLDTYLRTQAGQDIKKRVAAVFVLTPDGTTVAGFYSLSQYSVELGAVPDEVARRLPKYPLVPATLLGRLAVARDYRGRGLGEHLLMDALKRSLDASKLIGSDAVVVDAKDENAATFYSKYGFIQLPRIPHRLLLPMRTVEEMMKTGDPSSPAELS